MKYSSISNSGPLTIIGGMNVLESRELAFEVCGHFKSVTSDLGLPYVFKASFDKANRSSIESYRGPGMDVGLKLLSDIRAEFDVPVITDVHEPWQAAPVAEVVDFLQLPAFLARQTDLVTALAKTGKPVNIKKPQFLSPGQIVHIVQKFRAAGNDQVLICDRGTQFGYDNLVVDMLGFGVMKEVTGGLPLIFDVTHALQQRDSSSPVSGGRRSQLLELARAAVAVGIAGVFLESHPSPVHAKCDGPSGLALGQIRGVLEQLAEVDKLVKSFDRIAIE